MLITKRAYISCLDIGDVFQGIGVLRCLADFFGCVRNGAVGGYVGAGEDEGSGSFCRLGLFVCTCRTNFCGRFLGCDSRILGLWEASLCSFVFFAI